MSPFEGYRISSPYGMRIHPIDKVNKMHWGIDLTQYRGYPIPAFTEGIVEFTGGNLKTGFGLYARIRDKYGSRHYYAHLVAFRCKAGQTLKQGDFVGLMGNTGASTGTHLHYEVRLKGASTGTEPTQYLIDYYKKEKQSLTGLPMS